MKRREAPAATNQMPAPLYFDSTDDLSGDAIDALNAEFARL